LNHDTTSAKQKNLFLSLANNHPKKKSTNVENKQTIRDIMLEIFPFWKEVRKTGTGGTRLGEPRKGAREVMRGEKRNGLGEKLRKGKNC